MSDNDKYHNARFDTIDDIKTKLLKMDLGQLRKISQYCDTIKSEQYSFIDDTAKCRVCGKILFRPRRGPMPSYCSGKCRIKQHRQRIRQGGRDG